MHIRIRQVNKHVLSFVCNFAESHRQKTSLKWILEEGRLFVEIFKRAKLLYLIAKKQNKKTPKPIKAHHPDLS